MNIMLATSSSIPFPQIREEEDQDQMKEQLSSSPTLAAPTKNSQKRKRNLPGIPNSDVEVVALSPKALMATNRFICEVCNKGFQREQNLQLHRRGHNLPWKLRQKSTKEQKRKVYICPETTCAHHDPSRALGDLTGIKKHFSRKHGERKYKCEKCSKRYAVQSDWKAHLKTCGTKEYRCDCGTLFSRRDSFITHRAFCDTLAQETTTHSSGLSLLGSYLYGSSSHMDYLNISQLGVSQIPQIQDQNHTSNLLRLGRSSSGVRYQQLISPSNPPSFNQNQHNSQVIQSSPLFTSVSTHGHRESQHRIISEKPLHGLMELIPDFQNNTKNFTPNVPFNLNYMTSSMNDNENANNNGTTNLLSSTFFVSEPHMSATALLQKASQMDSTTSRSSSICAADRLPMFSDFDRNFGGDRLQRSQFENDNQLQGLMNSLANGGNSVFGGGNQQYNIFDGFGGHSVTLETHNNNISFSNMEGDKMNQNLCASLGGSNGLTLDFLSVGGMVRNMGGGFFK